MCGIPSSVAAIYSGLSGLIAAVKTTRSMSGVMFSFFCPMMTRIPSAARPAVIAEAKDIPSLKEAYAGKFDIGAAAPGNAFMSKKLIGLMADQFNILTPENELKPDSVLDVSRSRRLAEEDETAVAVHFDAAKPLLTFAQKNGIKVHGHVLVWHSQTPEAFFHEGYDTKKPLVSREVMLGRLENYIKGIFEATEAEWPGVVVSWDVLNEAVDDGTHGLRKCIWTQVIGEDYPNRAFGFARKYAPDGVRLFYNDYSTAYKDKRDGIIRLLKSIMEDGTIDGYGFQMHHGAGEPSMEQIRDSVQEIAELGLRLRVSELDVGTGGNSESAFTRQAKKYAGIMKLLIKFSDQFDAVEVWGLTDQMSWRAREFPLLFDGNGNPKPAFWAVADPDSVQ